MDIVINRCFGGFGLSEAAGKRYGELKGVTVIPPYDFNRDDSEFYTEDGEYKPGVVYDRSINRNDPVLVQVVRELGEAASGPFSELAVVTIPDDVNWTIRDYDGSERIEEVHRSWW